MLGFPTRDSTNQSAKETKHKVLFIGTRQFWFGLNFILITSHYENMSMQNTAIFHGSKNENC